MNDMLHQLKKIASAKHGCEEPSSVEISAREKTTTKCPASQTQSRKVQRITLEHLLSPAKVSTIQNAQYYYCPDPDCNVVYFSYENVPCFTIHDLNVKVLAKDISEDVPVCYCFGWTRHRIKNRLQEPGASNPATEISRDVRAGKCSCDIKNPTGRCCLGDIQSYIASIGNR